MKNKTRWFLTKRAFIIFILLNILAIATAFSLVSILSGDREANPRISKHSSHSSMSEDDIDTSLKLITLNMAHGRGTGPNQVFQNGDAIRFNLNEIVTVLRRERPGIVALQEADGPSIWSGKVNHVGYLAEKAAFPYSVRGEHVNGIKISYGTALLSMLPLREPVSVTFDPSPPTFSKGFVISTITWPGDPGMEIDVVSVHLDFSRKSIRQRQVEEMIEKLLPRKRSLIIMGDFNCDWQDKSSALRVLAEGLNLQGYEPHDSNMNTFPLLKKRLDWVLISKDLEFAKYEVLSDLISDHYGVVCELRRKS